MCFHHYTCASTKREFTLNFISTCVIFPNSAIILQHSITEGNKTEFVDVEGINQIHCNDVFFFLFKEIKHS